MLDHVAQSLRAAGGNAFELAVARILNEFLIADGIVVTRAKENALRALIGDSPDVRRIMEFTRIPVKRRCDQTQLEDYPDLDLFALVQPDTAGHPWRLLAIINCKVSFHARHTEATFWGLLIRLSSNVRFVMVTEDRDIYNVERPRTELGRSCQESTATRRLLEAFSDRIYLVKGYDGPDDPRLDADVHTKIEYLRQGRNEIVFDDVTLPHHTQYCHSVRPLDDLIDDLLRWRPEIPG